MSIGVDRGGPHLLRRSEAVGGSLRASDCGGSQIGSPGSRPEGTSEVPEAGLDVCTTTLAFYMLRVCQLRRIEDAVRTLAWASSGDVSAAWL